MSAKPWHYGNTITLSDAKSDVQLPRSACSPTGATHPGTAALALCRCRGCLPVQCAGQSYVAVLDQIRAVAKERFYKRIGTAGEIELADITEGLKRILELW